MWDLRHQFMNKVLTFLIVSFIFFLSLHLSLMIGLSFIWIYMIYSLCWSFYKSLLHMLKPSKTSLYHQASESIGVELFQLNQMFRVQIFEM